MRSENYVMLYELINLFSEIHSIYVSVLIQIKINTTLEKLD